MADPWGAGLDGLSEASVSETLTAYSSSAMIMCRWGAVR